MNTARQALIDTLASEHARVKALLQGLAAEADRAAKEDRSADLRLVRAALRELEVLDIPHHQRESRVLFPRIRQRCPPLAPVLDRLEREHARMEPMYRDLVAALDKVGAGDAARHPALGHQVKLFVEAGLGHMSVEESYIMPVATDFLTPQDFLDLSKAVAALSESLKAGQGPAASHVPREGTDRRTPPG